MRTVERVPITIRKLNSIFMAFAQTVTESFFATLECELLDRTHFAAHNQARAALFDFIEGFYNHRRRHSTIGYVSPHEHEEGFNRYSSAA